MRRTLCMLAYASVVGAAALTGLTGCEDKRKSDTVKVETPEGDVKVKVEKTDHDRE